VRLDFRGAINVFPLIRRPDGFWPRIELGAGEPQVLVQGGWLERMKIEDRDTGNSMACEKVLRPSAQIDIPALKGYRLAVGRRTREIAARLQPAELKRKVAPSRLEQVRAEGAVVEAAGDVLG